jgi:DNA invertase Pin-like site-specific DNA recombinase
MEKRSVLYCRVSRSTEESVSIDRQERELRAAAESAGWSVAQVFTDDGLSGRKDREKADAALGMLASGDAEVLLVWEMSRWSRMGLGAVAKLVAVLREREGLLFVAHKEGLRSDQPAFGIMAAVIAEVAAMEAEGTRDRILSMRSHVLSQTDPNEQRWLGGQPPMGYRAVDRSGAPGRALVIDDYEAAAIRRNAQELAAGGRLTDVTKWLQAEGVATPQSAARRARQAGESIVGLDAGEWRISTVRKLFLSPTLLGRTTKRVQVGTRSDGSPVWEYKVITDEQGMPIDRWAPIIDAGTWAAIQNAVRVRGPNAPRKAASWLSGFLVCGLCGSVLYANARKDRTVGSFRCSNKAIPGRACPGVSISRTLIEAYMEEAVLGMIGGLLEYRVTERVEGTAESGELDTVAQEIADVQVALADDTADYGRLLPRLDALKSRRRILLDTPGRTVRTVTPTGRTLNEAWAEGGIPERQFLLSDMLDSVKVMKPQGPGGAGKLADRLEEVWIDLPSEDD